MSDQIHELERREVAIHTAAIRAAIYAARGLRCENCLPLVIPCDCRPAERLGALIDDPDDTGSSAHD